MFSLYFCFILAETLEEVRQLEAALKSGVLPSEMQEAEIPSTVSLLDHYLNHTFQLQDVAEASKDPDEEMQDAD